MTRQQSSWIAAADGQRVACFRLFFFPYAGGTALFWRDWQDDLPGFVQACPVQLPGRGSRLSEPAFRRAGEAVDALIAGLQHWFDAPFAFFGHSMGAILAYELARRLFVEDRRGPEALYVSGACAPHIRDDKPAMHLLPRPELIERLRGLNGTPPELLENEELLDLYEPLLRADFELAATYSNSGQTVLSIPIHAFGGVDDEDVCLENLQAWSAYTHGPFRMSLFGGGHFFIKTQKQRVAAALSQALTANHSSRAVTAAW